MAVCLNKKLEDTNVVIRSPKSKMTDNTMAKIKRTNSYLQNTTQKTKD